MVEKTSEANAAHQETIKPADPALAKSPVATVSEALPDDQLDTVSGGAWPTTTMKYNTGPGG